MIVECIKPLSSKRYQIITDEQITFVLYRGELSRYHLEEGCELTGEVYRKIMEEVLIRRAKRRAMHLLTAQDRTQMQVREKLERDGYPQEAVEAAVRFLKDYHYLDDERYADAYICCMQGRKSIRYIRLELERKGVPREIITHVLEQTETGSEEPIIEELVYKKAGAPHTLDEKELRRLYGFLMRRGFQSQDIGKVFRRYQNCH